MLVLSRRRGERIVIGSKFLDDPSGILVEVLDISHDGRVRLGITAPKSIVINRAENVHNGPVSSEMRYVGEHKNASSKSPISEVTNSSQTGQSPE